jgi:CzcA family heavy metal efflux pump
MIVSTSAIGHRSTVFVLMLMFIVSGTYSYITLPRESSPDITIPNVFISTTYEGVSPSDVETLITLPIERKLKGLKDVENITSVSAEGSSTINVEFNPGVDIDNAVQWVRDKVDQAKSELPDDLPDDPSIREINFSDFPVLMLAVSGDVDETVLKAVAEKLEDQIEIIKGVMDVSIAGGREREIRIEFNPDRMFAYKLSFAEILRSVQMENVNIPGGSLDMGQRKYLLRIPGEFTEPGELDALIVANRDGKPIYLKDVASVRDAFEDRKTYARFNGRRCVTLAITKRSGENIIAVVDEIVALMEIAGKMVPEGVELSITMNQSKDIRRMVSELENNILTGLILVVSVLFFFLGLSNALFVASAIPFSMLLSFAVIQAMGLTLNMVVLFSLILALGMLVDNAIVVVENIYRHMQEGKDRKTASIEATAEVGWPIITSTLTTLCAFGPMMFWPGIMGEFMMYLPLTLIIVLSASLLVALIINPVICSTFMSVTTIEDKDADSKSWVMRSYKRFLKFALRHRWLVLLIAILFQIGIIFYYSGNGYGVELFPAGEPNKAIVAVEAPEGTSLDTSNQMALAIEKLLKDESDLRYSVAEVGVAGSGQGGQSHQCKLSLDFVERDERKEDSNDVLGRLRERLLAMAGAEITVKKQEKGPPTGPPVNVEISGDNVVVLGALVNEVKRAIKDIPGLVDLKDDFSKAKPEVRIDVDRNKATLLGLSTAEISTTIKAAFSGKKLGVYREGSDEYDIVGRLPEPRRQNLSDIGNLNIPTATGSQVPLSTVATIKLSSGYGAISHIDQKRVLTVSANTQGRNSNDVLKDVRERIKAIDFPPGYIVNYSGEQEEQQKASAFLMKAFLGAVSLISIVLLTQFNSIRQMLIVMTSVLLSLAGVFLGLLITKTPFGIIMTGIGVISLAGVVVNNAIVLIDYINQLRESGMAVDEALVKAGMVRFRPVMLTAVTTILGLIPMAVGVSYDFKKLAWDIGGESAQWWGPMAVAVIFGLAVATLLTLVVVPVLYSLGFREKATTGKEVSGCKPLL